jgi:hypothetical protein
MIIPYQTRPESADILRDVGGNILDELLAKMPLQIIPVVPREDVYKVKIVPSEPSPEACQIAKLIGERIVGEEIDATTDHAWLVVLGYFAQALELVARLETVPIEQRKGPECEPQTKLIEFLVGILGGLEYLQDLNLADNPIAKDQTVVEAWAQAIFVHYSGVSRTLDAADENTLAAVVEVLRAVSRPFIDAAVLEVIKKEGRLTVDVDLTGREVSPTSTDYPEAGFGWMDDDVRKGYQAAVTSLVCERWRRLLLTLQRYSGRTLSADCLQTAVKEVEELLGVRPRRRVELIKERRRELSERIEGLQETLDRNQQAQDVLWKRIHEARTEAKALQRQVADLETEYQAQGLQERSHCRLSKARRKLASAQKREPRTWRNLRKKQRQADDEQRRLDKLQEELLSLDEWWAYLEADNQANYNPVPITLRSDAGFSIGPNLTWLIEMGYTVLTKAHHGSTADSLRQQVSPQAEWTRVGRNADAMNMGTYSHNDCPYPLQAMLVRYNLPDKKRYTALLYYDETPPPTLPEWFARYNGRQTIEAGIKEEKAVFTLKRHLVRSPIGMQLQEQFALFAANFVRWAAAWVKDMLRQANRNFTVALAQVKTLVRIVSRARARWVRNALGHTLIFDENGPFAGTVICLSGQVAVQLALRLFSFAPF